MQYCRIDGWPLGRNDEGSCSSLQSLHSKPYYVKRGLVEAGYVRRDAHGHNSFLPCVQIVNRIAFILGTSASQHLSDERDSAYKLIALSDSKVAAVDVTTRQLATRPA